MSHNSELNLHRKLNSLCQWQLSAIIDCICLPAHVRFPGIAATFAATTCFFFTTKCTTNFCTACANIYVGNTAITAFCDRNISASRMFSVKIEDDKPWEHHFVLQWLLQLFCISSYKYGCKSFLLNNFKIICHFYNTRLYITAAFITFTFKLPSFHNNFSTLVFALFNCF